jgi:hypothetical protein
MGCNIFDSTAQDRADLGGMCTLAVFEVLFTVRYSGGNHGRGGGGGVHGRHRHGSPAERCELPQDAGESSWARGEAGDLLGEAA